MAKPIKLRKHEIGKYLKLVVLFKKGTDIKKSFSCMTRNPAKAISKLNQSNIMNVIYDGKKIYW